MCSLQFSIPITVKNLNRARLREPGPSRELTVLVPVKEVTGEPSCGDSVVPPCRKKVRGEGRARVVFLAGLQPLILARVPSGRVFLPWMVQASQLFKGCFPLRSGGLCSPARFPGLVGCCPLLATLL